MAIAGQSSGSMSCGARRDGHGRCCSSSGLARVPMAQAIALTFIAPLIALVLASLTLGERGRSGHDRGVAAGIRAGCW